MRPVLLAGAQPLHHWIAPDVMELRRYLVVIAQPMIKEPILPVDAERA
jgi:hypothetical protein